MSICGDLAAQCWFVGLTTLDVSHHVEQFPHSNEKVTARSQSLAAGGPSANAAVTAASQGVDATLITAIGDSPTASLARVDLQTHGVRIVDAATSHELSVSSVVVGPTGERAVVSMDAGSPVLDPPDLDLLPHPDVVQFDGHHPGLQRHVLGWAVERGVRIVLDAGRWRPIFEELIPRAHVVACSADFTLSGARSAVDRGLAEQILDLGARAVIITDGGNPVYWRTHDGSGTAPVPRVPVRDTLGAGDVFHGALSATLARGRPLTDSVDEAIRVASHRVQFEGPRSFLRSLQAPGG